MGSFANTVFSFLLGWLRTLTSAIWSALTNKGGKSFFDFIGRNWLMLALLFCLTGLIVDFIVYLFRWEPYKVWRSLIYRFGNTGITKNEPSFFELHPVSENETEEFSENETVYDHEDPDSYDISKMIIRRGETIQEDRQIKNDSEMVFPVSDPPEKKSARRRRAGLNRLFSDNNDEFRSVSTLSAVGKADAYNDPVYPEKWKEKEDRHS